MTVFGPFPALVIEVYDGDTVVMDIDLGFDHIIRGKDFQGKTRISCRVFGINAPELHTLEGAAAHEYAKGLLPVGAIVKVISHGWDKYGGRFDGDIEMVDGRDFGIAMIAAGYAVAKVYS